MKWFDRWFTRKCQEAWQEQSSQTVNDIGIKPIGIKPMRKLSGVERSLGDHRSTMNLQIHSASGGYVLEFTTYDQKRDEHDRNLHIITEQEHLGEAIAKIITVEMLRK